ncbi:type II secretion system protein [Nitrosophilus alvini]|uniref:type II secretion system protein n=1 Tax=Nitrosophilus alvini TaxID=2714855 RepID=UPI00190E2B41|nr:prepilin-type N-terminal cleavage/methylation domain-containing protein [Nitrosophilus alvini]
MRKAFTLIELIFVIVILGIIAVIGSGIFIRIYESYITSRAINELETKTELVLSQLAKRLSYRIKEATIARKQPNDSNITALSMADQNYQILEWIGYDNDGFRGEWDGTKYQPGWSGFIDLDSNETNKTKIKTPGSKLSYANSIISQLSNGAADLNNTGAAIIFKGLPLGFDINNYGWNENPNYGTIGNHNYVLRVKQAAGQEDVLEFTENLGSKDIVEQYYLVWSAYAVVPENGNLYLYSNYRPWFAERYNDGNRNLLAENVSVFKFRQIDKVIRLKLCLFKNITDDYNISFCKEKVVF